MASESNVVNLPLSDQPDVPSKDTIPKPEKALPSERIVMPKQLDYVRGYAVTSAFGSKAVRSADVAEVAKANVTTLHIINSFWVEIGLLQKTEAGFMPAPATVNYARAYEWNPKTAAHKLAPALRTTWFGAELLPKLSYRSMSEEEAIGDLAGAAGAAPKYRKNVKLLIDLMELAGLVVREGENIKKGSPSNVSEERPHEARSTAPETQQVKETATPVVVQPAKAGAVTGFSQSPDGVVQFHVSVRVDMAEFSSWTPDRISAFFAGIAQVLAAKGDVEKTRASG